MLEVIGVGFGRTGTLSLKRALEQLGFGRCYHFTEMLKARHARRWLKITDSDRPEWSSVFSGYRSTTDWPAAAYWRELADAYPDAKLILTTRDADKWFESVRETIWRLRELMPARLPGIRSIATIADRIIWDGVFDGRANDRDHAIACFHEHIDDVQRSVPADRLLVFDVRDGWEPLCRFLGVDVPDGIPFPRRNQRRTMRRNVQLLSLFRYLVPAAAALVIVVALALFYFAS